MLRPTVHVQQSKKHDAVSLQLITFQLIMIAPGRLLHKKAILRVFPDLKVSEAFFEELHKLEKRIMRHVLYADMPIEMTDDDIWLYETSDQQCIYCVQEIPEGEKVRDHCHVTGKFRGATCWQCNLQVQLRGTAQGGSVTQN